MSSDYDHAFRVFVNNAAVEGGEDEEITYADGSIPASPSIVVGTVCSIDGAPMRVCEVGTRIHTDHWRGAYVWAFARKAP